MKRFSLMIVLAVMTAGLGLASPTQAQTAGSSAMPATMGMPGTSGALAASGSIDPAGPVSYQWQERTFYDACVMQQWIYDMQCYGWCVVGQCPHYDYYGRLVAVTVRMERY
jgi:hypothetical protein